jgi:hypothetical protein
MADIITRQVKRTSLNMKSTPFCVVLPCRAIDVSEDLIAIIFRVEE